MQLQRDVGFGGRKGGRKEEIGETFELKGADRVKPRRRDRREGWRTGAQ